MKTFTIDNDNQISVFASKKEAAAASTPFDPFASQSELAELTAAWPMSRLVEIWNNTPGVTAVSKFTNRKIATERIWKAIQNLGVAPKPETTETAIVEAPVCPEPKQKPEGAAAEVAEPQPAVATEEAQPEPVIAEAQPNPEAAIGAQLAEQPEAVASSEPAPVEASANAGAQGAEVEPVVAPPTPKPTRRKKAASEPKAAAEPKATREGSKTAQVVAMLQREGGATLVEIMEKMGWQKHTVRGFMAGTMKKAGHAVESFRPEGGERTYRISK